MTLDTEQPVDAGPTPAALSDGPASTTTQGRLALLRDAVRGVRLDYTTAPIGRSIVMLAVPMVMEMLMESIFVVADVFWVGKLGATAVAAVGLTESLMVIIYTLAMGLSVGAMAVVARRIGEKDPEAAARVAVQSVVLGIVMAAMLGLAGGWYARELLFMMGASPEVIAHGSGFTRVMLGGNATVVLLFLINAVFRGAGDATVAMRVLWLGNAINIALGPCLIFGLGPFPELGVVGAAIATNIGRGTAVVYQLVTLARGRGRFRVGLRHLSISPSVMASVVRLSGSATVQIFIGTSSYIGLVRIISTFGSDAVAGYTIGIRLIIFALLPSFGISNAAATMVGQNLGAKRPDRAEQAVWRAALYNMIFLGSVALVFMLGANPIVAAFTEDPIVHGYGVACLRIVSAGFVFFAYGMVLTQSFNGAGDTWTPTIINLFVFWIFEIPLAWTLAKPLGVGAHGVFIALAVAYSTLAVVSAILFRRGSWKSKKV